MKKVICFVLTVLMVFCLCACSVEENDANQSTNALPPNVSVHIWTDEETGVQYIIYDGYKQGGIYPRLNADGGLHIEKGGAEMSGDKK